jgi:hypothetical protein
LLGRLPGLLAKAALGREWFVEVGLAVPAKPKNHLFGDGPTG